MADLLPPEMIQAILTAKADFDANQPPTTSLDAIYNAALACEGRMICPFADLNYGHLACAFAVNQVVQFALGSPIDDSISTAHIFSTLYHGGGEITVDRKPGSIVISPTQGNTHGHVGIFGVDDKIYSNSSNKLTLGVFEQNYDWDSWQRDLEENRGLTTYIFALSYPS